jgi:formamidopyrimidine-DNA glycosylase
MPELPDVEGFRRVLDGARGRRVRDVDVRDPGVLRGVSADRLRRRLTGRTLRRPERHGKWLVERTDGEPVLLFHFGMTGGLVRCRADTPLHPHDRVVLGLGAEQLRFRDQRKLQGIRLGDDATVEGLLAGLGPDAARVDQATFDDLLNGRAARVKTVLMDQSALAGLGNLLADEILWRARVHPARRARDLDSAERRRTLTAMRRVLRASMRAGEVPARDSWLTGHRDRPHRDCPRCGTRLRTTRIAGRTTAWCPHCQQP